MRSLGTRERARARRTSRQLATKDVLDFAGAALLLVVLLPMLLLVAGAVWIEMGGRLLFRQVRVGRHGTQFEILKFRTMAEETEAELDVGDDMCAACNAARISRVRRFLRATSLDELPQLITVLRGEMSSVGPRPERAPLVERFVAQIPDYDLRHRVKSGITGWALIQGVERGSNRFRTDELPYHVQLYNHYIDHCSGGSM